VYQTDTQEKRHSITPGDKILSIALSADGSELLTNQSQTNPQVCLWVNGLFTKSYIGHKQETCIIGCGFGGTSEEYIVSGSEDG
jgi:hypothetical protein